MTGQDHIRRQRARPATCADRWSANRPAQCRAPGRDADRRRWRLLRRRRPRAARDRGARQISEIATRSSTVPEFVVPAVATTQKGFAPAAQIFCDRAFQLLRIELQGFVHRDAAQSLASDSQQTGGFVERMMRLGGSVNHRPRADRRDTMLPRNRETSHASASARPLKLASLPPAGKRAVELRRASRRARRSSERFRVQFSKPAASGPASPVADSEPATSASASTPM